MSEVNVMWELFAEQLTAAVDTSVPVKQFTKANEREPILFTKEARKLVDKHRKTYSLFEKISNPFYQTLQRGTALK